MTRILVTGATGTVGRTVTSLLAGRPGVRVRAFVRDPTRAAEVLPAGVEPAVGDFADATSVAAALDGVDAVYLSCANVPAQVEYETRVVDLAAQAEVRRVVKLSARGAELGSPVAFWHWHAVVEQHLADSGLPAVVLQPGFLLTNLLASVEPVQEQGVLVAPAADARVAMVDPRDVAAVAAAALLEEGHEGQRYVLTGPEAVGFQAVAAALSAATGRDVAYVDVPPAAAHDAMVRAGMPEFVAGQLGAVFAALRRGDQASTTDQVSAVTGRAPRSVTEFALDHAAVFRPRGVGAPA